MDRDRDIEFSLVKALKEGVETEHLTRVKKENQLIPHNFKVEHKRSFVCELEGCDSEFEITVFPKQLIYPKFCPPHRNQHQRDFFLEQLASNDD